MTTGSLAKWIEELDQAHEKLQKRVDKIVAGGGFNPSAYVYTTPFIDLSAETVTVTFNSEARASHTATVDCVAFITIAYDETTIIISDGTNSKTELLNQNAYRQVYVKAGQTISERVMSEPPSAEGKTAFKVYALQQSQLQEAPVGLLGRIAKKVKKAIKGGE